MVECMTLFSSSKVCIVLLGTISQVRFRRWMGVEFRAEMMDIRPEKLLIARQRYRKEMG